MPATVAVKLLEPGKEAGYWGLAGSIYAKAFFHIDADANTTVAQVKARIAAAQSVEEQTLKVLLFGKELDSERTLGSYGTGNIEDPLLHAVPAK